LPEWLLAPAYALLGWNIGLGFTKPVLLHAMRGLPQILLSVAVLMGFCGALAFLLTRLLDIDPLSAYLATSPGGMDSIAIIAASTKVDLSFVMALQTMRFLLVLLLGPMIARFVARVVRRRQND
jgi:membrane AbrB-like protein